MNIFEQWKVQAMAKALQDSRSRALSVRMPPVVPTDYMYKTIDISLKVWDVLNGLIEIAGAVKLAAGASAAATVSAEAIAASELAAQAAATVGLSTKVGAALTFAEAVSLAGPLVAYVGLWIGLGAPYLEAKQKIAENAAKSGVVQGVLVGAYGWSPDRARAYCYAQNMAINNNWVPDAQNIANMSYIMGFIAGYKQGRDMSISQRRVFWKVFAETLRASRTELWRHDWPDIKLQRWFWEAGGVFMRYHLK